MSRIWDIYPDSPRSSRSYDRRQSARVGSRPPTEEDIHESFRADTAPASISPLSPGRSGRRAAGRRVWRCYRWVGFDQPAVADARSGPVGRTDLGHISIKVISGRFVERTVLDLYRRRGFVAVWRPLQRLSTIPRAVRRRCCGRHRASCRFRQSRDERWHSTRPPRRLQVIQADSRRPPARRAATPR